MQQQPHALTGRCSFGFVQFTEHEAAMSVLQHVNNNAELLAGARRLQLEFALDDVRKAKAHEKKLQRVKAAAHNRCVRRCASASRVPMSAPR